ncbi:MAG: zinc ribbon domain-containing protein, partial [Acidobacteria bacterium Pan2503]|nr:zinc ribbon domain-containing protein [Candidatus Acidoferrum panamensis]
MYCSKCGVLMADGAMFCAACGQAFSTAAVMARPMNAQVATAPRVEYGGFWLRFLAYLVDGAVILIGICVVAIPLVFLTGLGAYLSNINPEQDWNE